MSKIDDAFDQVRGLAEKFAAILEVADEVKKIGSIEQAIGERKAQLSRISSDTEAAQYSLTTAQNEVKDAEERLLNTRLRSQIDAQEIVNKAEIEADAIRASANADAEAQLEDARQKIAAAWASYDATLQTRQEGLADLNRELQAVYAGLASVKAEHETTAAAIESIKATAKAVLA